jgi:hypothetical protein
MQWLARFEHHVIADVDHVVDWTESNRGESFLHPRGALTSTNPIENGTGIATNSSISAVFNVEMDPLTMTTTKFILMNGTTEVPGSIDYNGFTASFVPASDLTPNTLYKATVTTGVKGLDGIGLSKDFVWSFTTGAVPDITKPTVTLTDPLNNATGVSFNKKIAVTYSEGMDQTTINTSTFTLKKGSTSITGVVTYVANKATFAPSTNLEANTTYTLTVTTGSSDMAGNSLAINNIFTFTTALAADIMLPMVNATSPLNNATGVERNKMVTLTFSEEMDPLTITSNTFTLKQGTTNVPGVVGYSVKTASFTPATPLTSGLIYTATITTGAKDLAGNALAANLVWSFTTSGSTSPIGVVNLGAAANYVILAKSAITNISTSAITGDLGLSPAATSYVTGLSITNAIGYAISAQVTGSIFAADMADPTPINLTTAVENMITAYNDAAGRPSPDFFELGTGNIGGKTLTAGLYKWTNSVTMPSDVTISGGANDVWIFQIAQNMNVSNGVNITLVGGAQAKNIFWQVGGTVTIGTTAHIEGIILSMTGITLQTGASFKGRALAQTAVVLDGNAVVKPF